MNQINETILRDEIQWLLEAISEQIRNINSENSKIPQIEFDIIMENIRKLYQDMILLNKQDYGHRDTFVSRVEIPEVAPVIQSTPIKEVMNPQIPQQNALTTGPEPVIINFVKPSSSEVVTQNPPTELEMDLFSSGMSEFSEKLIEVREQTYAREREASLPKQLKSSISINEKFLFINELFDGNLREYNATIEVLNGFSDAREALEFLDSLRTTNLWESESTAFRRLAELVMERY